jgi:hypothetical protein
MPADRKLLSIDHIRSVELLAETFARESIRYAIIGGLGAMLRGRLRFTQDVDVLLEVPQIRLPGLLDRLEQCGFQFDQATVIREFVREHMTVISYGETRIDWLKPVIPIYFRVLEDASPALWTEDCSPIVASSEGLILTKLIAFRLQDQVDIEALLIANRDDLDLELIRREWATVSEDHEDRTAWLESAFKRLVPERA